MIRVLLVDDHTHNLDLIEGILYGIDAGIKVDRAENGTTAIKLAKAGDYDLILMDIALPDIDGIQVTRQLREFEQQRKLRVVAITAYSMQGEGETLRKIFDDYITKPVNEENVKAVFNKLAKGRL